MKMKSMLLAAGAMAIHASVATAQVSDDMVKIGVLTDMSGPYSAATGTPVVEAVRMAVVDFGGKVLGKPIEVVSADLQGRPDVGVGIATRWFDADRVDVIVDVPNTPVALAVQGIAKDRNRVFIAGSAASPDLTGKACSPTGVHYIYDSYSFAATAAAAAVAQPGSRSYYFLTVDYGFGLAMEEILTGFLKARGAEIVGGVRHPMGAPDLSSFLLQAQASKADVIALANAGGDTINAIKTAKEFGITKSQKMLALVIAEPDIHGIGLDAAQGMLLPSAFFWSRTPESTAWSRKFAARVGRMPNSVQAGAYSYTMHYLKAIQAAGTDEAKAVVRKMKEIPVDDWFAKGKIREDGRMIHDMYLVQVKSPATSKEPWDYLELVDTIPGDKAFRPLDKGGCPFIKS